MIGDDDDAAPRRNAFALAVADGDTEIEMIERLLDKIKTRQVRIALGEILRFMRFVANDETIQIDDAAVSE